MAKSGNSLSSAYLRTNRAIIMQARAYNSAGTAIRFEYHMTQYGERASDKACREKVVNKC